jgi:phospholipid transport system substrate-binding protein
MISGYRTPRFQTLRAAALALTLVTLAAAPVLAAPPPSPKGHIDAIYQRVKTAADKAETQEALTQKVLGELDTFIDYVAFSARTLKISWEGLSAEQKTTFIDRFKRLVMRTYAKKFQPKAEFAVEYRGDIEYDDDAKTQATVKTTVRGKKNIAADVDYLLHHMDKDGEKGWYAYDIIIDEVSMALNWRAQFEKIIAKEGFDSLIAKIDKKVSAP